MQKGFGANYKNSEDNHSKGFQEGDTFIYPGTKTLILQSSQNDVLPFLQSLISGLWGQSLPPYLNLSVSMGFDQKVSLPQLTQ